MNQCLSSKGMGAQNEVASDKVVYIDSVAIKNKAINDLRNSEAYQHFHRNKVGQVFKDGEQDLACFKADMKPS